MEKIKRKFDEFQIVFSTHVLNLPTEVPRQAFKMKRSKLVRIFSPGMPQINDENDDSFVSVERHLESMRNEQNENEESKLQPQ